MSEPLGLGIDEPVDHSGAFPRLGDDQRARLRAVGKVRSVTPGEVLFREGDATTTSSSSSPARLRSCAATASRTGGRGPRPTPLPRRAQPADRRAGLSDRRRPRPGGGDPGSPPTGCGSCCASTRSWQHRVPCLHVAPHDPDRPGRRGQLIGSRYSPTAAGCASSWHATGCRLSGWTSSPTRRPRAPAGAVDHAVRDAGRDPRRRGAPQSVQRGSWAGCLGSAPAARRRRCATS